MIAPGDREDRRSRPRPSPKGFKKGDDRDQGFGVRMVLAPVRWASLLLALSLVVAAFPGFSQTLPSVDGLENDTDEASGDTNLTTTVEETTDLLEESNDTVEGPPDETVDETSDTLNVTVDSPLLGDEVSEGRVDATASCLTHESGDGRLVCTAPPSCKDRLYRTHACMPPPQCIDQGNHTFECYPREQLDRVADAGPHAAPWSGSAACLASPHAWDTLVCKLPDRCLGDLGATQACRPAPGCQAQDGWFVCRPGQNPSSGSLDPGTSEDPETPDLVELGREVQALTRSSMDTFRSGLDRLRATYQVGLDDIQAGYDAETATARQTYLSCLEAGGQDAQARQACQDAAREQLDASRAEAREEERQLRKGLLDRAETLRAGTCQHLASQSQALISQARGALRLTDAVDVTKLSLCQDELARLGGS